jgi:hypothetical protein
VLSPTPRPLRHRRHRVPAPRSRSPGPIDALIRTRSKRGVPIATRVSQTAQNGPQKKLWPDTRISTGRQEVRSSWRVRWDAGTADDPGLCSKCCRRHCPSRLCRTSRDPARADGVGMAVPGRSAVSLIAVPGGAPPPFRHGVGSRHNWATRPQGVRACTGLCYLLSRLLGPPSRQHVSPGRRGTPSGLAARGCLPPDTAPLVPITP